jgi:hypothetical protein
MKTLDFNPHINYSEPSEAQLEIPSLDFLRAQTVSIKGKYLLVGLSSEQAEAIINLAQANNLDVFDTTLSSEDFNELSSIRFPHVTATSKTLNLGRSPGCMLELYQLLT